MLPGLRPTLLADPPAAGPFRFGLVASGWRSTVFLRLAALAPAHLQVSGVLTRSAECGAAVESTWGVATVRTLSELVATGPEAVVSLVPTEVAPAAVREVVIACGLPVLSETPPARDLASLGERWSEVGPGGRVQVAEQHPRYPGHAARLALLAGGALVTVTDAQVCSTHDYHAMALLRAFLGAGHAEVAVTAHASTALLSDPVVRDAWRGDAEPRPTALVRAHLDLGDGRTGLYDFTDNQWHNPLRSRPVAVRGSLGAPSAGEWSSLTPWPGVSSPPVTTHARPPGSRARVSGGRARARGRPPARCRTCCPTCCRG